ncbi:hypothetical protein ACFX2C_002513 [Malus domestica]
MGWLQATGRRQGSLAAAAAASFRPKKGGGHWSSLATAGHGLGPWQKKPSLLGCLGDTRAGRVKPNKPRACVVWAEAKRGPSKLLQAILSLDSG